MLIGRHLRLDRKPLRRPQLSIAVTSLAPCVMRHAQQHCRHQRLVPHPESGPPPVMSPLALPPNRILLYHSTLFAPSNITVFSVNFMAL